MTSRTYYVSTPIYYVNDRPHIGHVYTTTIADVMARYKRLSGFEVFFLTGTDEHAAKVVDSAASRGLTPIQWADQNAQAFEDTFRKLGITNSDFIRTTQDRHKTRVQEYVQALMKSGDIYLGDYEGWYDAGQEEYVTDARAKETDFKSPINGKPLVRKTEKNFFFRLSAYREPLIALLERRESVQGSTFNVEPEVRKTEIINRIREMNDVPISRTGQGDWGIRIPGHDDHAIYVWIDALFNYLSTVDTPERRKFWPADVHLIAKDILWFHAAIWPAMLLALGKCPGYEWVRLPRSVYSHSFWISEGQKMSKSLGNFIDLEKIESYVQTFGLDALRFFLASEGPLGTTDSDFAEAKFIESYNSFLANKLGNTLSRLSKLVETAFGGELPEYSEPADLCLELDDTDFVNKHLDAFVTKDDAGQMGKSQRGLFIETYNRELVTHLDDLKSYVFNSENLLGGMAEQVEYYFQDMKLNGVIEVIDLALFRISNIIEILVPFKVLKFSPCEGNRKILGAILYACFEALRAISVFLHPFIPIKSARIWDLLGLDYEYQLANGSVQPYLKKWIRWHELKPGTRIKCGDPLFPRYQPPKKA